MSVFSFHERAPDATNIPTSLTPQGLTSAEMVGLMERQEAEDESHREALDEYHRQRGSSLWGLAGNAWVEESLAKVAHDKVVDHAQVYDPEFDPEKEIPEDWPSRYKDGLRDAYNQQHFEILKSRYEGQMRYEELQDYYGGVGTAVTIGSMILHPETFALGVGELATLGKLGVTGVRRLAVGGSIAGLSNLGQELAIISNNKGRDMVGAYVAAGTGFALGGALSMFGNQAAKDAKLVRELIGKEYAKAVGVDVKVAATPAIVQEPKDVTALIELTSTLRHRRTSPEDAQVLDELTGGLKFRRPDDLSVRTTVDDAVTDPVTDPVVPVAPVKDAIMDFNARELAEIDNAIPRQAAYTGMLKSIGAEGMASKNAVVRMLHWHTVEYAPGTGGKITASQSAALTSDVYTDQLRTVFHPVRLDGLKDWKRRMVKGWVAPWNTKHDVAFDRHVIAELNYRRLGAPKDYTTDPAVKKVADAYEAMETARIDMLKKAGVRGYNNLQAESTHVSHRWSPTQLNTLTNATSPEFVMNLLKQGILRSKEFAKPKYKRFKGGFTPEMQDERAGFMAKAIYERFMRRPNTVNQARASYITKKDRALLEKRLEEAIENPAQLRHIMSSIDGKDARLLHEYMSQIDMDLMASVDGHTVMDLLDASLGRTIDTSMRRSAGKAAMAKKGFKDQSDYLDVVEAAGEEYQRLGLDTSAIQKETTKLQKLWNIVLGENVEADPGSTSAQWMRAVRRAATFSSMNQVGFAQTAEIGRLGGAIGVRMMLKQIPQLAQMRRSMVTGKYSDPMLRDFEAAFGTRLGDNHLLNHPMLQAADGGYGLANESSGAFMRGLDTMVAKGLHVQGYINGMNQIIRWQQRMHARGFFLRMHEDLSRAGGVTPGRSARYRDIGLSDRDMKDISAAMKEHIELGKGWYGQTRPVNFHLAEFPPALQEKLGLAFYKARNQAVQKGVGGEGMWFAETGFGKLMTQFRQFPLVALEKQTIHDLKMMDIEAFTTLGFSLGIASAAYMTKTYANSFGMERHKRKKYLQNRLTPGAISGGAAGWMGQASLIPEVGDAVMSGFGFDNPFRYTAQRGTKSRNHSEDISIADLAPGLSYLNSVYRATTGVGISALNGESLANSTYRHLTRAIPFNNALGITNAFHYLGRD